MMSGQTSPPGHEESAAASPPGMVASPSASRIGASAPFITAWAVTAKTIRTSRARRLPVPTSTVRRETQPPASTMPAPNSAPPSSTDSDRQVGCEEPVRLEGDQVGGNGQPGAGNRTRQRHRPGAQRRQAIAPLADQAAAQAEGTALRQGAVGAAEHQTQQHGCRERCQFLESQLLEHREPPPPGRTAAGPTKSKTSSTKVRKTDRDADRAVRTGS